MTTRLTSAWLIRWEWVGDHAKVEKPEIDIVSYRKDVRYVKEYVQRLHDLFCLTLGERAPRERYTRPASRIYPAEVHRTRGGNVEVHCGHNPWIVARPVRNLVVETTEAGADKSVRWEPYR